MHFAHGRLPQVKKSRVAVALDAWSKRQAESGHGGLPNLGFGGTLVATFVTSYFAAQIADALLVIILYSPRAFFVQGIRVSDWKHGVLSNGATVGPLTGLITFVWWMLLIACGTWRMRTQTRCFCFGASPNPRDPEDTLSFSRFRFPAAAAPNLSPARRERRRVSLRTVGSPRTV